MKRNNNILFAFVRRHLQPYHIDIEDVVQEVWVRIWRAAPRYKPLARFTTWMCRIAWCLCVNKVGDFKKRPITSMEGLDFPISDNPARCLEFEELAAGWRNKIKHLHHGSQELLMLLDGVEYKDVQALVGRSCNSMKMQVWKGRQELRKF